jgi:hypothetical protein
MDEKIINLGYMNEWDQGNFPAEYLKCMENGHELTYRQAGRCNMEFTCCVCNIRWNVDSSD